VIKISGQCVKVAMVVLNWNKSDLTISLAANVENIEKDLNPTIIIVDNGSIIEERQKLVNFAISRSNWRVISEDNLDKYNNTTTSNVIILLNHNYGYAKGNNYGLKLAYRLGYRYAVISNNDVIMEHPVIAQLIESMEKLENVAVIGPKIVGPKNDIQGPFDKPSLYDLFFYQIFYPVLWPIEKARKQLLKRKRTTAVQFPYRLMGCFMVVNLEVMSKIDWLDENTFLYAEELILAEKLRRVGYKTAYVDSVYVKHLHGVSTMGMGKRNIIMRLIDSNLYYFKTYRGYNKIELALVKFGLLYNNFFLRPIVVTLKSGFKLLFGK